MIRSNGPPIDDLFPARPISKDADIAARDLAAAMNQHHLRDHENDDVLSARVRGYELAARMQLAVPEVADLAR